MSAFNYKSRGSTEENGGSHPEALCFVVDSTASMGPWIRALTKILPELIQMTALTGSFQYLSIIVYGDYDSRWDKPVEFSGWLRPDDPSLGQYAADMEPKGGGGHPEAVKTALYNLVDASVATSFPDGVLHQVRVLHLTDASAHITGSNLDAEGRAEKKHLGKAKFDWVHLTTRHIVPLPITYSCLTTVDFVPYFYLAEATGGAVHRIKETDALFDDIKGILNGWFGLLPAGQLTNIFYVVDTANTKTAAAVTENDFKMQLRWRSVARDVAVPSLVASVERIAARMRSDEDYASMAAQLLDNITRCSPMVLCSNALFGKLWREICRRRKDPRRLVLMQQLDRSSAKLNTADRVVFEEWNRASYNQADEIAQELDDFVREHGVTDGQFVTFSPDLVQQPCDMLEFSRACTAADQAAVVQVLMRLVVVTRREYACQPLTAAELEAHALGEDDDAPNSSKPSLLPPNSLPMNLPPTRMFSLLLHLAAPGTALTHRPATIVALLASRCGCVLAPMADQHLQATKGNWLTWEKMVNEKGETVPVVAENFCVSFLYLLKSHEVVLTDTEVVMVRKLLKFAFADRILKMEVDVETFQEGSMDGVYPDHLRTCDSTRGCGKKRAISLITADDLCGYCVWDELECVPRENRVVEKEVPAELTFMVQCAVCSAFYARDRKVQVLGRSQCFVCYQKGYLAYEAVELGNHKKLKVKASQGKGARVGPSVTHRVLSLDETPAAAAARASCRDIKHSPHVECRICKLLFVTYHGLPGGTCAACSVSPCQRKPVYTSITLTVARLFWPTNRGCSTETRQETADRKVCEATLFGLLGVTAQSAFNCSLLVAMEILTETAVTVPAAFPDLSLNGRAVCNSVAVWAKLAEAAQKQAFEHSLCAVCCDAFPADRLILACGRHNCSQRICTGCGEAWYGDLMPGQLVNTRHLSCPFCVQPPTAKTVTRWNKAAKSLRGTTMFDPRYFYAWCVRCNHAVEYAPRACGAGGDNDAGPRLNNYTCEPCRLLREEEAERLRQEQERLAELQMRRNMVRLGVAERNATIQARREAVARNTLSRATSSSSKYTRYVEFQTCPNPKCGIMVSRSSGCNHISCPCGCHFCYECGEGFDFAGDCYTHLVKAHGRIFYDEEPMYLDDDDD